MHFDKAVPMINFAIFAEQIGSLRLIYVSTRVFTISGIQRVYDLVINRGLSRLSQKPVRSVDLRTDIHVLVGGCVDIALFAVPRSIHYSGGVACIFYEFYCASKYKI